ncbi:hypothetical protein [Mycoplasma todarodis]|uniref:Uncharacterized protein n=1 Tax=Mycoplasma todarodis TaxID=1937191 RepID=A0A4R0XUB4_9MOLU|nr:hypothetical protein [Mycoplasma todarodis]TCG11269.1 hypothetical protein C4B25_02030 [Mycoplasma todarodis]
MKILAKTFKWVRNRFDNVWTETYPWYWHIANILGGIICALVFVLTQKNYSTGTLVGLFFAITAIGYVIMFAFTYGVVRSRNAWTKKRK